MICPETDTGSDKMPGQPWRGSRNRNFGAARSWPHRKMANSRMATDFFRLARSFPANGAFGGGADLLTAGAVLADCAGGSEEGLRAGAGTDLGLAWNSGAFSSSLILKSLQKDKIKGLFDLFLIPPADVVHFDIGVFPDHDFHGRFFPLEDWMSGRRRDPLFQ